ncbi:MAG: alpha/beta fold hydrolase [Calditrichaeota bacterium]|nr:alpha/beta fold hydrolase [Calditrichota bacterium]
MRALINSVLALFLILVTMQAQPESKAQPGWEQPIKLGRQFVTLLEKSRFDSAYSFFDAKMKEALPAEKLKGIWQSLQSQTGAFKKQGSVRTETFQQYRIVYVTCEFEKSALDAKIVFDAQNKIAGLFFVPHQEPKSYEAPDYVDPNKFVEIDTLKLHTTWALPTSLSLPNGEGPFPAVVLVHGSGPNDRDETIGPNKPFRDLAWGLASNGIAVLRYEKRTRVFPNIVDSLKGHFTIIEETVEDALAGVSFLRQIAEIDPERIIVLGHSLGGYAIPRIARYYPRLAGVIIMAGSARPLTELIQEQYQYIFNLDGKISADEQKKMQQLDSLIAKIKSPEFLQSASPTEIILGAPPAYWKDLNSYDPLKMIERLKKPVLVLQGGRDYQVTSKDFELWKEHLKANPKATFKFYPDLNHLFIKGEGRSTPAEYGLPGHVDRQVIDDIANWVHNNF